MNSELIQNLLSKVSEIPGNTVSCISLQSFNVVMTQNDQSITLTFFIPTKFPEVSPLCSIVDSNNISDTALTQIDSRISEICTFIKNQFNIFLLITQEVRSILWKQSDSNVEDVRFPDSIEASRLIVETTLNQNISNEWIRKRAKTFLSKPSFEQDKKTRYCLLVYCFFKMCKGDYSLEECADLLVKEFHIIDPPYPPLQSIPAVISKLPDHFQELLKTSESNEYSQTMSFFSDFDVISLCAPSVVRARNRVDKRIYAIKVIHLNQKTSTLPPGINKITHLQHRYIVRYYNYWISDCDENESRAISDAFCLTPIKEPATFLFVQMDYLTGRPLSDLLHDPHFFECSGLQWRITQQVLEALSYLHSQDFVHNSMTPTNIIIDGENAKIGDFSDRTKQITFPYWDSRSIRDKKSDMFAFGVVFFEMWHPFTSEEERLKILTALVKEGEVPEQWKSVFPLQAKIVSLLMQPENNRPTAKELLPLIPAKIVEKEELYDLAQLTSAISAGNIQLKLHAPEVLESLFMDSRRLPFRLSDFNDPRLNYLKKNSFSFIRVLKMLSENMNSNSSDSNEYLAEHGFVNSMLNTHQQIRSFETYLISTFYATAQSFGALYYQSSIITPLTNNDSAVVVMSNDGVLHELQSSCTRSFKAMAESSQVKNAFSTYTRLSRLRESTHSANRIYEDDVLSFNTVNKRRSICNYFQHVLFIIQYGVQILRKVGGQFGDTQPVVKISHPGLTNWIINKMRWKNPKSRDANDFVKKFKKIIEVKYKDNANIDEVRNYLNDLEMLVSFYNTASNGICKWPIIMTFSTNMEPSFLLMLSVSDTVVAYSQTVVNEKNAETENEIPFITSTRVLILNAVSAFDLGGLDELLDVKNEKSLISNRKTFLANSYKPDSKELFIVIVCKPFSAAKPIDEIKREVYSGKEWNRAFVQLMPVANLLRKNGFPVSFANNDGKSVHYHLINSTTSFIRLVIVAYVDERNKITLKLLDNPTFVESLDAVIMSHRDFKRRITLQYPPEQETVAA